MIQHRDLFAVIILSYYIYITSLMAQSRANTIFYSTFMGYRGMGAHRTQWFSIGAQDLSMWYDL